MQVDINSNLVAVETTDKRRGMLKVDSETKITVDGKTAKLSDSKQGMQAKIAFNRQSFKYIFEVQRGHPARRPRTFSTIFLGTGYQNRFVSMTFR